MDLRTEFAMKSRIQSALNSLDIQPLFSQDFIKSFQSLGMDERDAEAKLIYIIGHFITMNRLVIAEQRIFDALSNTSISMHEHIPLTVKINQALQGRAQKIFDQVAPHLKNMTGPVIDLGCVDG